MSRQAKLKIAAVLTALVASMGVTTAAVAADSVNDATRVWCC